MMSSEQARDIALESEGKFKPQEGVWTLVAPDGTRWSGNSPMQALKAERDARIPVTVQLARVLSVADDESAPVKWHTCEESSECAACDQDAASARLLAPADHNGCKRQDKAAMVVPEQWDRAVTAAHAVCFAWKSGIAIPHREAPKLADAILAMEAARQGGKAP